MNSPPGRLRKRRWRSLVWLLVLAAGAIAALFALRGRGPEPRQVRVHQVERGTVHDRVSTVAAGRLSARREVNLRAEFAGTVLTLHHRRGDRVKAGDPLLSFDVDDLRDRVRVAESTVALGRAQSEQALASAKVAERNAERARKLQEVGALPPAEADNVIGQEDIAHKAADAARASIQQGLANVEVARNALRKATLRAPFEGVVLSTGIEEGETAAPGTPLVALADLSLLYVAAEIDESDVGKLRPGMPAEVTFDAFPGERVNGTLRLIAPLVARDLRGNRSVGIEVDVAPDPRFLVGMSAEVDVIVATRRDAVWVPPNAVQGRGTDRAVLLVDGGVARRRPIEVGIATWEAVEVTRGLEPGDKVILTRAGQEIADGARVAIEGNGAPPAGQAPVSAK